MYECGGQGGQCGAGFMLGLEGVLCDADRGHQRFVGAGLMYCFCSVGCPERLC